MPFTPGPDEVICIPYRFRDYLELVDWSGRAIRADKKGYIRHSAPPILQRLGMQPEQLLEYLQHKPDTLLCALGPVSLIRQMAKHLGARFLHGISLARQLYPERG